MWIFSELYHSGMHCQQDTDEVPGGLFIEPTFSTFAFFVIYFLPQITVFLHFPESAISLKSTRVLLSKNVKNPSGALVFSSLSGLDSLCSELRQVFVGTVLPPPLPRPNVRPNLAIEQGWIRSIIYVTHCKTILHSVASYMCGSAGRYYSSVASYL